MSEQPRKYRARWAVLLGAATIVAALFAWDPGDDDAPAAAVKTSGRTAPVRASKVEVGTLVETGSYPGELVTDAADLAANVSGRLLDVRVRLGDQVKAKDELARIDSTEWVRQRAEMLAEMRAAVATERRVSAELEAARRELSRVQHLVDDQVVSAQQGDVVATRVTSLSAQLDEAKAQRARAKARVEILEQKIADCRLLAPFDGVVSNRYVDPGAFLAMGTPILRVVASGPLRVRFEVPESNAALIREGAAVTVHTSSNGSKTGAGAEAAGKISGVGGEVDRTRRIVRTEAIIAEPPASWLPGMFAEVRMPLRTHEESLLVPDVAVLSRATDRGAEETGVFEIDGQQARWVPVRVLAREQRKVAVEGPLAAGDAVLIAGHTELSDGALVRLNEEGSR